MKRAKADYDYETDTLSIYVASRSYDSSFHQGNFIFDIDTDKRIMGLEILNASKVFKVSKDSMLDSGQVLIEMIILDSSIKISIVMDKVELNTELSLEEFKSDFLRSSKMKVAFA